MAKYELGDKRRRYILELHYEQDVSIDETALDVEWLQQSNLMYKYARYQAETKKAMDEAKERLDFIRAKVEMDIRANPENYGLSKVTESAIASTILLQPEYQEASKKYIEAKYENDVATAAVRAIDQKKTALENLVKLLSVSYFAGPSAPRDLSLKWTEHIKRREQKEHNKNVKIRRRS
jgi:hypothetical protein